MKGKKRSIITIIAIIAIALGILAGIYVVNKTKEQSQISQSDITSQDKEKSVDTLTDIEKEIAGIDSDSSKDEEKNYSEIYKEYLELPEETKKELEVIPRKEEVPYEKLEEIKQEINKNNNENEIPTSFNLADKISIKVENQGSYGLCWDFASLKTLETYLALNNLGNYDFSELHMDYITSNLMYGYRGLHEGGNFEIFKSYLTESGVVEEEKVPYNFKEYTEEEYNKFTDFEKVIEVTETVDFPTVYKSGDNKMSDEQLTEFRNTVKKHIMKNGGLYTSIVASSMKNAYIAEDDTNSFCNHAVTIVGWDDNYSKDNFSGANGEKPTHDGAYIALNSWGPASNENGYYYISYDDKYVELNLSGIISTSMENAYKVESIKNLAIKNYLKKEYSHMFIKYNGEDYVTKNMLSSIMSIDLSNSNVYSLDGIEIFNNIYMIDISNNNIKDLTPLSKIKTLSTIKASHNQIKNVSVLKDLGKDSEYMTLSLDVSDNPYVTGFEELQRLGSLNISRCNIKDVGFLENCTKLTELAAEDTPGIIGLDKLPENIYFLNLSNCNLEKLPQEDGILLNVNSLNVSNNNLVNLNGIEQLKEINEINVSGNQISDWSKLIELKLDYSVNDYMMFQIIAENCGIEDASIFSKVYDGIGLDLANNNIKDVSCFKDKYIYYMDLSHNKGITGLSGLNATNIIILNDCDIKDVSEITKLENAYSLSLENNNITDLSEFSKMKNLSELSLAGNQSLTGTLAIEELGLLNLSNCNLAENFDFSKVPNLYLVNISKNQNITDVYNLMKNMKNEYLTVVADEISYDQFQKLRNERNNIQFNDIIIEVKGATSKNNQIDLSEYKEIRKILMRCFNSNVYEIINGELGKNCRTIDITKNEENNVEIKIDGYGNGLYNSTIKIKYTTDNIDEQNNVDNSENTNTIQENTDLTNNTTNQTKNV